LLVGALAIPVGLLVAAPGGAAAPTTATCKTLTGTATFTPPLPAVKSAKAKVTINIKAAKLAGCTGAGGASGALTFTATEKTAGNCITLAIGGSVTGKETIAWANKTTSTATAITLKTTKVVTTSTLNGKIATGTLKGKTQTGAITFVTPKAGAATGDCVKTALKSIAVKVPAKALTIK
jgi:hypothetical protein